MEDYGINKPDSTVLYPDVALTVAQAVAAGTHERIEAPFTLRGKNK